MRCRGKVALVTGAARGQGLAEAEALIAEGARVCLADLDPEVHEQAARLGDAAIGIQLDVTDESSWLATLAHIENALGPVAILVNNAGVIRRSLLEDQVVEDADLMWNVNVIGTLLGIKTVAGSMRRTGSGSIINISSAGGMSAYPMSGVYCATKWAVRGLTKTAALELANDRIRVNSVHPGLIDTDMVSGDDQVAAFAQETVMRHPIPRLGSPDEVARAVVFLASEDSTFVTGAELVIDGGELAGERFSPTGSENA